MITTRYTLLSVLTAAIFLMAFSSNTYASKQHSVYSANGFKCNVKQTEGKPQRVSCSGKFPGTKATVSGSGYMVVSLSYEPDDKPASYTYNSDTGCVWILEKGGKKLTQETTTVINRTGTPKKFSIATLPSAKAWCK